MQQSHSITKLIYKCKACGALCYTCTHTAARNSTLKAESLLYTQSSVPTFIAGNLPSTSQELCLPQGCRISHKASSESNLALPTFGSPRIIPWKLSLLVCSAHTHCTATKLIPTRNISVGLKANCSTHSLHEKTGAASGDAEGGRPTIAHQHSAAGACRWGGHGYPSQPICHDHPFHQKWPHWAARGKWPTNGVPPEETGPKDIGKTHMHACVSLRSLFVLKIWEYQCPSKSDMLVVCQEAPLGLPAQFCWLFQKTLCKAQEGTQSGY